MLKVDDKSIDVLLSKYAKLNELNEQQLDSVRELVKESIEAGIQIGEVNGALQTVEVYNQITQKLMLARTFTASMTAIVLTYPFILLVKNMWFVIVATAVANTLAFYLIDLGALGAKKAWTKIKEVFERFTK